MKCCTLPQPVGFFCCCFLGGRGLALDTTEIYSLVPVCMALTLILGHSSVRKRNVLCSFIPNFSAALVLVFLIQHLVCCHSMLVCWRSYWISFHMIDIQQRELCLADVTYYTFNSEPISFKLGMVQDMTILFRLISVWMTLTFTQGHRFIGKLEPVQSSNLNFRDDWLCWEDDSKDVLWIWIVWALALLVWLF